MAEYGSYSIPSGVLDVWERRRNQKRLGGQSYNPLEATAFMKGVIEAELGKQLTRRKLAEDKEARDKALALQETSIANTKDYQDRSLAQQADQFTRAQEAADDVRKDTAEASLINAGLQGTRLLLGSLLKGGSKDTGRETDSVSPLRKASDYFKKTLGGEIPGGETGGTTGAASYFSPEDTGDAFMTQASAPTAPTPAIGSDINAVPSSTYETMTKAYQDASLGEKPTGAYRMASQDTGSMSDAGGRLPQPAIGSPVARPDMPGVQTSKTPFETETGLETTNAAEPMFGTTSSGAQSTTLDAADIPAYQPPSLAEYQAPTLDPYQAPTLAPFVYNTPKSAFTEAQWLAQGGEYGEGWQDRFKAWQNAQWARDRDIWKIRYDNWAAEENRKAKETYDQWAADESRRAKEAYDQWVAEENAKAEQTYADAVKSYKKGTAAGTGGEEGSPWSFNTKRLGGGPLDEYYGNQFTPASDSMLPAAFDPTGYFTPSDEKKYSGHATNFTPAYGNTAYEVLSRFTSEPERISSSKVVPDYEPFNYEPPSHGSGSSASSDDFESPYSFMSYEPFNYEPGPGEEAYNYEPGDYEPFNAGAAPSAPTGAPSVSVNAGSGKSTVSISLPTIVCGELNRQGRLPDDVAVKDSEYRTKHIPDNVYAGYLTLFGPVVALMRRSKLFTNIVRPFGVATAREMASRVDPNIKGNPLGKALLRIGVPLCGAVGDAVLSAMATWVRATTEVKHG